MGDGKIKGSFIGSSSTLIVHGLETVHAAVQQLLAVEVGAVGDAVDLALEGLDFLLEVWAIAGAAVVAIMYLIFSPLGIGA